jgi:hypothetical protein
MRTSLLMFTLGACLMAAPAVFAASPSPDPECDGVKKPTDGDQTPDKASAQPLCDGVKKPSDGDGHPPKS